MVTNMKLKSIGLKHTASGGANGRSSAASRNTARRYPYLAICVRNDGVAASLERGKAYRVVRPLPDDPRGRIRVLDEENEDYLYHADWFVPIQVAPAARKSVLKAVSPA